MKSKHSHVATFLAIAALLMWMCDTACFAGGASLSTTFENPAYALEPACVLSDPLLTLNVTVSNDGNATSSPGTLLVVDQQRTLYGEIAQPALDKGRSSKIHILVGVDTRSNPAAPPVGPTGIAGAHAITLWMRTSGVTTQISAPLAVIVPASFCAAQVAALPTTAPGVATSMSDHPRPGLKAIFQLAAPAALHSVHGGPECAAHVGSLGALVCPDMIASGNLLLAWTWDAHAGPSAIDGYRIYRTNGFGRFPVIVATVRNAAQTLADIPKLPGGYAGACYSATAFSGAHESAYGDTYCADGGSVATTTSLAPVHVRSTERTHGHASPSLSGSPFGTDPFVPGDLVVGFAYEDQKNLISDGFSNTIDRAGFAFDLASLASRQLVSAKLSMDIVKSLGDGNNHSCATDVGAGTEYWWLYDAGSWLDGSFGNTIAPTDTGPRISADVTPIVAAWLRGDPNYGFVLKNSDENLDAFTNNECRTSFARATLEITHY